MTSKTHHNIHPSLDHLAQPIHNITPLPNNPRKGDTEAVKKSYAKFGQRKPIIANSDGTIIAGNHQHAAARQLNWTHIAVLYVDDDDLTAKAYALADNQTGQLGGWDNDNLTELLAELTATPDLLATTGFTDNTLTKLLGETTGENPPTHTLHVCPECGHEWT